MDSYHRGHTLLELLTTLSILTVLLLFGLIPIHSTLKKSEADAAIEGIYRAWAYARSESIRRSKTLLICGTNNGLTCAKRWTAALLIFEDKNKDKIVNDGELIHHHSIDINSGIIESRISFGKSYALITETGRASLSGSFLYCDKVSNLPSDRKITWSLSGRPYLTGGYSKAKGSSTVSCSKKQIHQQ